MNFLKDYLAQKRAFDIFLSGTGLIFSFPLWVIFAFAVWLEDRGSIFYVQERAGKDGKIFKSIKFRSMIPQAEKDSGPISAKMNDPRNTNIGQILRVTAMDELPQLINILKGDMSFVGPRALRPEERELNNSSKTRSIFEIPGFEIRSKVRPGLTGVAQIFASRNLAPEEKFKYDLWYINNMNFRLDIKLIAKSFLVTLKTKWDI
ncbi:MAG: hypothetical protein A2166_03020 [Omnitrophica WOR_2 bacterium RBG_13_41_10]|nr:MAG: hypothetical protein A2166_03020 [Omnitrophica WOR_2 bacterium RBG_13_41_10]